MIYAGLRRDPPCISAAPAALDRYLAVLPAMSLIPLVPFTELLAWQAATVALGVERGDTARFPQC
jgi:hypothetical protein